MYGSVTLWELVLRHMGGHTVKHAAGPGVVHAYIVLQWNVSIPDVQQTVHMCECMSYKDCCIGKTSHHWRRCLSSLQWCRWFGHGTKVKLTCTDQQVGCEDNSTSSNMSKA